MQQLSKRKYHRPSFFFGKDSKFTITTWISRYYGGKKMLFPETLLSTRTLQSGPFKVEFLLYAVEATKPAKRKGNQVPL